MKITSANIQFLTEYSQRESEQRKAFLAANIHTPDNSSVSAPNTHTNHQFDTTERVALNSNSSFNTYSSSSVKRNGAQAAQQITTQKAVSSMLARFYSQSVRLTDMSFSPQVSQQLGQENENQTARHFSIAAGKFYEYQTEQSVSFVARGEIQTEDGRTINFELFAQANQNFQYQSGSGAYAGQVTQRTDPLVINLQGDYNNLSNSVFQFDLDNDGNSEELSFAGQGSGFLVLDKNDDGKVNNGSELFGPSTGNGFSELAEYDDDGNGFIDSGDAAFNKLHVWVKDTEGNDKFLSLKETDVAAIGVESGYTPFAIKDHYNNEYGQAQRSGIFVRESGEVGSLQQINLTHRDTEAEQALKAKFNQSVQQEQQRNQRATARDANESALDTDRVHVIESAMKRLDAVTQTMLSRHDELAEMNDESSPKSLIQQIVEKLEETRIDQQAQKAEETQNSQLNQGL